MQGVCAKGGAVGCANVGALLDGCVMVEQGLGQPCQELGLRVVGVLAAARGEGDLGADDDAQRVGSREGMLEPIGCCQWVLQSWGRLMEIWQQVEVGWPRVARLGQNGMWGLCWWCRGGWLQPAELPTAGVWLVRGLRGGAGSADAKAMGDWWGRRSRGSARCARSMKMRTK